MKVWALVSAKVHDDCEHLALSGLFTSRELALDYLAEWVLGPDIAATLCWEQAPENAEFWEGHDPEHIHCYIILTEPVRAGPVRNVLR